jgi:WD40 repeat protein
MIYILDAATGKKTKRITHGIKTLNIETMSEEKNISLTGFPETIVVSPCGNYILILNDSNDGIICLDTSTGKIISFFKTIERYQGSLEPCFFISEEKTYDYKNCREIKFIPEESNCIAYSHNGKFIVSGQGGRYSHFSDLETTLQMYNAETGEKIKLFPHLRAIILSADFSPDDKYVVTGSAHWQILLWDAGTGALVRRYQGH